MYSYGHPGSFNPAVVTNKEAGDLRKHEKRKSSQAAGFHKKTSRKFLPQKPVEFVPDVTARLKH